MLHLFCCLLSSVFNSDTGFILFFLFYPLGPNMNPLSGSTRRIVMRIQISLTKILDHCQRVVLLLPVTFCLPTVPKVINIYFLSSLFNRWIVRILLLMSKEKCRPLRVRVADPFRSIGTLFIIFLDPESTISCRISVAFYRC